MKELILVTGGAGFIGSHTVDLLIKKGYRVRVMDNLSRFENGRWPNYLNKKAEKFKGDVVNIKDWEKALKGVSYVIHLAALMDLLPNLSKYFEINAKGTANLYEVVSSKKIKIKKIVVASSQFVYGQGKWHCVKDGDVYPGDRNSKDLKIRIWDSKCPRCGKKIKYLKNSEDRVDPPNQYAISKYTQELIALKLGKMYNIPSIAFRYSIVHGSRQSIKSLYSGALRQFVLYTIFGIPLETYEDGMQLRDFVSVKDVANAHLLALRNSNMDYQVFNIGGGKSYTVIELSKMVVNQMKLGKVASPTGEYRIGDIRHAVSRISKIKKFGWSPEISEKENVAEFIKWVRYLNPDRSVVESGIKKLKTLIRIGKSS